MGKYTRANRWVRNTAIRQTGKVIFNDDDQIIKEIVELASVRSRIPAKELHRQYRHYRNRLQIAAKDCIKNATSVTETALKHQVCAKVLAIAFNQLSSS
ncbi:hypothetical protein OTK49_00805 [Vibrio coralliirubri]|uniref:hypothetical protein n=1 Tax=Vibrio coralliirubri TaxID=1516159 RepID=UPI002284D3DB|nr:hypothetical protein [Vibrio coralliirubri]MCY9861070.1 hypothetical protein [Vibrio coralliirubri]